MSSDIMPTNANIDLPVSPTHDFFEPASSSATKQYAPQQHFESVVAENERDPTLLAREHTSDTELLASDFWMRDDL